MKPASRLSLLKPSPIRAITDGTPPGAIPLGLGEPTWDLPEVARKALLRDPGPCAYVPHAGLLDLRRAVAAFHGATVDEVLITTGSQGALFSLFQAWVDPGAKVLMPDPGFVAYPALARMAGAVPVAYPLSGDRFRLDADALIRVLDATPDASAVVLNLPSNPTGGGGSLEALKRVADACLARGVLLISDEVYRDLHFGTRCPSLRDVTDRGVVTSSVSKGWGAPGLRVGWAVGDPAWLVPARTVHGYAVTGTATPAQWAALALIEHSEAILAEARAAVGERWEALAEALREELDQAPAAPDGTFYHFMALPEAAHADPVAFALKLRDEAKVVLIPGLAFGEGGRGHARLSFAATPGQLREGVRRLAPYWKN
ncbi:MAG TPA: pyridoxal phosphate-dependent aminotransferase [Holophagaceae bacterium]|nr:pyridoxal phosphate-dependent aminotransferase [Holophagaceae bacterium]